MSRRLSGVVGALVAVFVLAFAAMAYAATVRSSGPSTTRAAPAVYQATPAASHSVNCPNMGGSSGSPGSSSSGGSSGSNL